MTTFKATAHQIGCNPEFFNRIQRLLPLAGMNWRGFVGQLTESTSRSTHYSKFTATMAADRLA